jgi:hypothetical protein
MSKKSTLNERERALITRTIVLFSIFIHAWVVGDSAELKRSRKGLAACGVTLRVLARSKEILP